LAEKFNWEELKKDTDDTFDSTNSDASRILDSLWRALQKIKSNIERIKQEAAYIITTLSVGEQELWRNDEKNRLDNEIVQYQNNIEKVKTDLHNLSSENAT
jgi:hypothetical protein